MQSHALSGQDQAIIDQAKALLSARLRLPGAVIDSPRTARDLIWLHLAAVEREVFAVFFFDAQLRLIEFEEMFRGTLTQTSVYPREVVRRALQLNAAAVVFAHNHPSGVAEPSRADEYLTETLKTALAMVDVRAIDHLVIGAEGVVSFAARGLM